MMLQELIITPIILFLLLCENGLTRCGDRCVDLQTDVNNCKTCNDVCQFVNAISGCANGACIIQSCEPGFGNCDNDATNGCEVDLNNDATNCFTCANKCPIPINGRATCTGG